MESETRCKVSGAWSPTMPEGLAFEVSHHPLTMKQVVNLIVTMERFKGHEAPVSTEFRDEDLLNMMLDSFMEGNADALFTGFTNGQKNPEKKKNQTTLCFP